MIVSRDDAKIRKEIFDLHNKLGGGQIGKLLGLG